MGVWFGLFLLEICRGWCEGLCYLMVYLICWLLVKIVLLLWNLRLVVSFLGLLLMGLVNIVSIMCMFII